MKKLFYRLLPLLLLSALLLSLAACAQGPDDTVPQGMMLASCVGADYRLYVPTSWVANTSYGVSGAYRNLSKLSTVSVNRYDIPAEMTAEPAPAEQADRLGYFHATYCLPPIASTALDGKLTMDTEKCIPTTLDGVNAKQYVFHGLIDGTTLHFLQVVAERNGGFYVLSFAATAEMYELCLSDVEKIVSEFVFDEPYMPSTYVKELEKDENTPAGMKVAYGKDVAYRFYVPTAWEVRMDDTVYAAVHPTDRSSVSVMPYMPDADNMSVAEYLQMNRDQMTRLLGTDALEVISDSQKVDLGGRQATVFEYRLTLGGQVYRYRQYVAAYKSMIYSLTYTARDADFEAHLGDLDMIVANFKFR